MKGSKEEFLGKIAWEGGVDMALDYGLETDGYDLPEDMAAGWDQLRTMWLVFDSAAKAWTDLYDPEDLTSG